MKIKRFRIHTFRNLNQIEVFPASGLNGFWGENGQGKTNLLEALYGALKGKSFRPYAQRKDWISLNGMKPYTYLELEDDAGFPIEIACGLSEKDRWFWEWNQKRAPSTKIAERIPIVVFSPDDHELLRGAPEIRRSYLDDLYTDICPGYGETLSRFEKALKNRNAILKTLRNSQLSLPPAHLETWTKQLAQEAYGLMELRAALWPEFEQRLIEILNQLFHQTRIGTVGARFLPDYQEERLSVESIEQKIMEHFAADLATGWTHRGPHRDDFTLTLDGLEARTKASQGQARLIALGLKWVHAVWVKEGRGESPLFFIDDFSSELDESRRTKLVDFIFSISGQIFMTGTDLALVTQIKETPFQLSQYQVKDGSLYHYYSGEDASTKELSFSSIK